MPPTKKRVRATATVDYKRLNEGSATPFADDTVKDEEMIDSPLGILGRSEEVGANMVDADEVMLQQRNDVRPFPKSANFRQNFTIVDENFAQCNHCAAQLSIKNVANSTGNFTRHLKRRHAKGVKNTQQQLVSQRGDHVSVLDQGDFTTDMTKMMIESLLPFSIADKPNFKALFEYLGKTVPSPSTLKRRLSDMYLEAQSDLKMELEKADSISIGFDEWSDSDHSYLGVVVIYALRGVRRERVADFQILENGSAAKRLANKLNNTLVSLDIKGRVNAFVADNASANSAAMELLTMTSEREMIEGSFYPPLVPCLSHIIDLIASEILKNFDKEEGGEGPIMRLRSFVAKLHRDATLKKIWREMDEFEDAGVSSDDELDNAQSLTRKPHTKAFPVLDDPTHWKTTCYMIDSALKTNTRMLFLAREIGFPLSLKDFSLYGDLRFCLKPFLKAANLASSVDDQPGASFFSAVFMEIGDMFKNANLATSLKTASQVPASFPTLNGSSFKALLGAEEIFIKYLKQVLSKETLLICSLLDPRIKEEAFTPLVYFFPELPTLVQKAKTKIMTMIAKTPSTEQNSILGVTSGKALMMSGLARREELQERELSKFLQLPIERNPLTPLQWWTLHKEDFPALYPLAVEVVSVPCSSVSVERLFSVSKDAIEDSMISLSAETMKQALVVRDYYRSKGQEFEFLGNEYEDTDEYL